mmetsp:Transcript_84702/g.133292  ORF Transcript_84702/g.133292 Transcript_84702/m.133292 type:complete len:371 (-) Transcript_84702:62-1174(-)
MRTLRVLLLSSTFAGHTSCLFEELEASMQERPIEVEDHLSSLASFLFSLGAFSIKPASRWRYGIGNCRSEISLAHDALPKLDASSLRRNSGLAMTAEENMELSDLVDSWIEEERQEGDEIDNINVVDDNTQIEDSSDTVLTDDICLVPGEPEVRIEIAPSNSRRIFTGIDIFAPVDTIWKTLTDYENLGDVVPSVVSNEVMYRTKNGGARLSQIGAAKVLPGITFRAKTVLDVIPYDEDHPIPSRMLLDNLPVDTSDFDEREHFKNVPLTRGIFPRPYAYTSLPHKDLTMQNVKGEGDFTHYQGVWRMQELPGCAAPGEFASRLTYAVEIQPKAFVPVALIEGKIASELKANMEAIKEYVEKQSTRASAK